MRKARKERRIKRLDSLIRSMAALGLLVLSACATGPEVETQSGTVFYPPLPDLPRLQFLMSLNSEDDLGGGSSGLQDFLSGASASSKRLQRPWDMAHEKGKIYVLDKSLNVVVVVDLAKGTFDIMKDTKGGPMKNPMSIFVTKDGHKYVADRGRQQILVYNERDEFLRAYGAEKQFSPIDVVVFENRVYVCDIQENEIEILDRETGEVIRKVGGIGEHKGSMYRPTHLAVDNMGNFYVTDFLNFRIQKFDKEGNFLKTIGESGTFPGATPRPKGVAVDHDGYIYAVDAAFELVQIFDGKTANVLMGFGKFGPGGGTTYLPAGIHIDYDNVKYFEKYVDKNFKPKYLVFVANQAGNNKLNVYAFGEWIGPPPAGVKPSAASPTQTAPAVPPTVPALPTGS